MTASDETGLKRTDEKVGQSGEVSPEALLTLKDAIRCPGLTVGADEVERFVEDVLKRLRVYFYKETMSCLWVVFVGGTGTGKSTLFNSLCGESISRTGVERPKTGGPIAYAPGTCAIAHGFPLEDIYVEMADDTDAASRLSAGCPGRLATFVHDREDWSHLIMLDTPDMDSVETRNLASVEAFYLMADAVVFVTSQDKYADDVPYRFLVRIARDRTTCFLLVNKAHDLTKEEILIPLRKQDAVFPEECTYEKDAKSPVSILRAIESIGVMEIGDEVKEKVRHGISLNPEEHDFAAIADGEIALVDRSGAMVAVVDKSGNSCRYRLVVPWQ